MYISERINVPHFTTSAPIANNLNLYCFYIYIIPGSFVAVVGRLEVSSVVPSTA